MGGENENEGEDTGSLGEAPDARSGGVPLSEAPLISTRAGDQHSWRGKSEIGAYLKPKRPKSNRGERTQTFVGRENRDRAKFLPRVTLSMGRKM